MLKYILFLFVITVNTIAEPFAEYPENLEYSRYIAFPDGNGAMHPVDLEAEPNMKLLNDIERDPNINKYLLFTRRNQRSSQPLSLNNSNSILYSNFNSLVTTVVIAHGWFSNQYDDVNPSIRDAILDKSFANVIVLDWSRLAMSDYSTVTRGVPTVGRHLGLFLAFLNAVTGQSFSNMHLVGFSVGAHVVANAGRDLGGIIGRITALDPAGPMWNYNSYRIRASDAIYVEVIHTDSAYTAGSLGIVSNVGKADFYPNGGTNQPGCYTNICNHNRAWELFAATIQYNHLFGRQCHNTIQLTRKNCFGPILRMGNDDMKKTGQGMYLLETGRWYPF